MGINRYRKALRLHYAVNDARSVTAALQKLGFPKRNIITLLDERATALAIRTAFNTLVGKTRLQDRVFIFVAAHGLTLDRPGGGAMGYLIPVDGDMSRLLSTGLPMSQVRDMARSLPAKHVFFKIYAWQEEIRSWMHQPSSREISTEAAVQQDKPRASGVIAPRPAAVRDLNKRHGRSHYRGILEI